MDPIKQFEEEKRARIEAYGTDTGFKSLSKHWLIESMRKKYVYNFSWLGRPVIQNPIDMVAMQELIWTVKPDLIIETGIAHGGSLVFSASMLELMSLCGGGDGEVLGIDIDIRPHNRKEIEAHPLAKRISMIEGSSVDTAVIAEVRRRASGKRRVLVCLDSNHTYEHVRAELDAYAPLTSIGSYCVVFDTFVEDAPADLFPDRPWGPGDNPKVAVTEYLKTHPEFEIDRSVENKLLITVAPDGFLRRVC
jgi:cephalosporin hydroxylase